MRLIVAGQMRAQKTDGVASGLMEDMGEIVVASVMWCDDGSNGFGAARRTAPMKTVQFIDLLLYSLVVAVFWGTWFSLSRSIADLSADTFLEIGRTMIANLGGPMSLLLPAAVLATLVLMVILARRHERVAATWTTMAFVLLVTSMVTTLAVNVPIDQEIHAWTTTTLPSTWEATRDRWELFHTIRTFLSLAGLLCLFASVLVTARPAARMASRPA
jgi:uncharacterized membrane protein